MNTQEVKIVVNGTTPDKRSFLSKETIDRLTSVVIDRKENYWDVQDYDDLMARELYRSGRYSDTEGCVANAVSAVFDSAARHYPHGSASVAWATNWFKNATDADLSELADKALINRMGRDHWYAFEKEY